MSSFWSKNRKDRLKFTNSRFQMIGKKIKH